MNTKNLFFTCLFLLVTLTAATVVSNRQKALLPVQNNMEMPATTESMPVDMVPFDHHDHADKGGHRHPDDDGKYHYFHFERIPQFRRGRTACIFCAKTVIAIIHLAALLLGYMSVIH